MKKFLFYLLRWQLSTVILAPCIYYLPFGAIVKSIIANLIGGCLFFWFDKWLFRNDEKVIHNNEYILPKEVQKQCFGEMKTKFDYEFDNRKFSWRR